MKYVAFYQTEEGGVSAVVDKFEEWLWAMKDSGIPEDILRLMNEIVGQDSVVDSISYLNGDFVVKFRDDAKFKDIEKIIETIAASYDIPFNAKMKFDMYYGLVLEIDNING